MGSLSAGVLKRLVLAVAALMVGVAGAAADTTVKWLHIEVNPAQVKIWEEVARAYEAAHPGVKVEMQFLENEATRPSCRPFCNRRTGRTSSTAGPAAC